MRIVLDASVAIEWFIPGVNPDITARALNVLELGRSRRVEFIAPDFFWAEVGNVFTKAVRQKRWDLAMISAAVADLEALNIVTESAHSLLVRAMDIALAHGQSVYDTLYVELALARRVDMITSDLRLFNALGARYPVRWLGGFNI